VSKLKRKFHEIGANNFVELTFSRYDQILVTTITYISGETKPDDRERIRHEMEDAGKTIIGYEVKIEGKNYKIKSDTLIFLENGDKKTINELTENDEICEEWFKSERHNFTSF
jgi:hypothetical protein